MILLTIIAVVGFIAFLLAFMDLIVEDWSEFIIAGVISLLCLSFSFSCIYKIETTPWIYDKEPWYSEKIVAMNDNNLTSGRGYSRRVYINEELYYQYIEELKNGGYQADKVKASITTVYYDNENPRVDWYKKRKKWLWMEKEETFYKMYVPEGTISDEFTIDLQ